MGLFFRDIEDEAKEPNYNLKVRRFFKSKDFEETFSAARPYLITGLVAWPLFWLYKGLEWPSRRGKEALPMYIRKTFFQAKLLQLFIISSGIVAATYHESDTLQRFLDMKE